MMHSFLGTWRLEEVGYWPIIGQLTGFFLNKGLITARLKDLGL